MGQGSMDSYSISFQEYCITIGIAGGAELSTPHSPAAVRRRSAGKKSGAATKRQKSNASTPVIIVILGILMLASLKKGVLLIRDLH